MQAPAVAIEPAVAVGSTVVPGAPLFTWSPAAGS
jgi:hypothetical protein